jgi:hypothetical protein
LQWFYDASIEAYRNMKEFDANKGCWGIAVIVATMLTILTSAIIIYQFTTGNTHLSININFSQPTAANSSATPVPTVASSGLTPTSTTIEVTPTPVPSAHDKATSTIAYDFWTWVWWIVTGFVASGMAAGLFGVIGKVEDGITGMGFFVSFLTTILFAWLSGFWLNHMSGGFWLSLGVECVTAMAIGVLMAIIFNNTEEPPTA